MSRIWVALLLVSLIIGLCFLEANQLNTVIEESDSYLTRMKTSFEKKDYASAQSLADSLNEYWTQKEKILRNFVPSRELDEISTELAAIPLLADNNNSDFLYHCNVVKLRLEQIQNHSRYRVL